MSANSSSSIIRFSTFEVNVQTGELRQRGQKLRVQEQPFQLLVALLERPGELVTREELHKKLWPADTFVDFEHGLNAAIKRLRDALGESAEAPIFIETLARRGYRFIAPVDGSLTPITVGIARGSEPRKSYLRYRVSPWMFATASLVIAAAAILLFLRRGVVPAPKAEPRYGVYQGLAPKSICRRQEREGGGPTEQEGRNCKPVRMITRLDLEDKFPRGNHRTQHACPKNVQRSS
jgi:DNA-binding winged helix-turn-helix (wHTH) protein